MLRTTLLRASFFLALLLGTSAFPFESSGYNPNIDGSGTDETLDRAKRDVLIVQEEVIYIVDPQDLGDASGFFSGMSPDLQEGEENIRSRRSVSEEGSGSEANANSTCAAFSDCYDDKDCNGGKCNGFALNTCDCNKCLQMSFCKNDGDCGGLRGACATNGLCDCYAAYKAHGYKDILEAWSTLCNAKKCTKDSMASDCFGLPCNKGFCTC